MKFHLAYTDAQGSVVTDFKSIVLHYLKDPAGFFLDFVSLFPYELIGAPIQDTQKRTAALLYLRLPHIFRVVRIQWFFSEEEKRLNQKYVCAIIPNSASLLIYSLNTHTHTHTHTHKNTATSLTQVHRIDLSVHSLCCLYLVHARLSG